MQTFGEGELRELTESVFDPFWVDIQFGWLSTFTEINLVLGLSLVDSIDLVDLDKPKVVIFSKFVDLLLMLEGESMIEDDSPLLWDESVGLAPIEVEPIMVANPCPVVFRQFQFQVLTVPHLYLLFIFKG